MNPLEKLTQLPRAKQEQRGLLYTPREIARQPAVWPSTLSIVDERINEV